MQHRAAKLRLLQGLRTEPAATAGALGSPSGVRATPGEAGSTLGRYSREALRTLTMDTRAGRRHVALPPIWSLRTLLCWSAQLNQQHQWGYTEGTKLHSSSKSPGEENAGHVWKCSLSKVKAILTFSYWPLRGWNHPSSNKVKSMRNTNVTFKFTSNPGSKVKLPASRHHVGPWPFVWTEVVWFSGTWCGPPCSAPCQGPLPDAVFWRGRAWTSCLGGKALGGCWGYRGVPLWGMGEAWRRILCGGRGENGYTASTLTTIFCHLSWSTLIFTKQ